MGPVAHLRRTRAVENPLPVESAAEYRGPGAGCHRRQIPQTHDLPSQSGQLRIDRAIRPVPTLRHPAQQVFIQYIRRRGYRRQPQDAPLDQPTWHSPPVFMGRVNQIPMFRDCTWGGKYALRKSVSPVNGPTKKTRNVHNTSFLRMARPAATAGVCPSGPKTGGLPASGSPFVSAAPAFG